MKKLYTLILIACILALTPLFGASIMDGRGKKKQNPAFKHRTETQAKPYSSEAEMKMPGYTAKSDSEKKTDDGIDPNSKGWADMRETSAQNPFGLKQKKVDRLRARIQKRLKKAKQHGGSSATGILALVFGTVGFIIAFVGIFALAPALIIAAFFLSIAAIVLGAIGLGTEDGKGMSIAGFILGLVTIVIPVLIGGLIVALILAI